MHASTYEVKIYLQVAYNITPGTNNSSTNIVLSVYKDYTANIYFAVFIYDFTQHKTKKN